jgi:hypothetical protein
MGAQSIVDERLEVSLTIAEAQVNGLRTTDSRTYPKG